MKKRVLFVFHDNNSKSGGSASMLDVLKAIGAQSNFNIEVLLPKVSGDLAAIINDTYDFDVKQERYHGSRVQVSTSKLNTLINHLKALVRFFITFIAAFRSAKKFKHVDLIYSNTTDNCMGMLLSFFLRKPHIIHIREFGKEDQAMVQLVPDKLYYNIVSKISRRLIVISKSLYEKISLYADEKRIVLVYDDVDLRKCKYNNTVNLDNPLRILMVGTLSDGKGQTLAINAIHRLKTMGYNINLGLAGDDKTDYALFLKNMTRDLNVEKLVTFLGFRTDIDDIRQFYDIGLVASSSEAFGRITIEGMSSGLLMIGSDTGATPEIIEHSITGFLFKSGNVDDLVEKIKFIDNNRSLIGPIKDSAREFSCCFDNGKAAMIISELINTELY